MKNTRVIQEKQALKAIQLKRIQQKLKNECRVPREIPISVQTIKI